MLFKKFVVVEMKLRKLSATTINEENVSAVKI